MLPNEIGFLFFNGEKGRSNAIFANRLTFGLFGQSLPFVGKILLGTCLSFLQLSDDAGQLAIEKSRD